MASFWDWIDYHSNQKTKSQISADVHRAAMESHLKTELPVSLHQTRNFPQVTHL